MNKDKIMRTVIAVPTELFEKIKKAAKKEERSYAYVCRMAIEKFFEMIEGEKK